MKRPAGSRGEYAKTAQRRQDILRTAVEVFTERGYEASSFREIAARVGMSETGVAFHFGGKAALLAAVLEIRGEQDAARWGGGGVIAPDRLTELVAHNAGQPGMVQLFTKLAAEGTSKNSRAHPFFTDRYDKIRRGTADHVRASQRDGRTRADLDPDLVAQVLIAVMDGLQVQWLYDESLDMAAAMDLLLSTWLPPHTPGPVTA